MIRLTAALAMVWSLAIPASAQKVLLSAAADSKTVQDCIKTNSAPDKDWEVCIGSVSKTCLTNEASMPTSELNACLDRERVVWDDILNETFRRLREKLDAEQQGKLRDMQRAWIASRDATCTFYWDYFQGTMASPMSANCINRETARRALFLLGFLNDAENK